MTLMSPSNSSIRLQYYLLSCRKVSARCATSAPNYCYLASSPLSCISYYLIIGVSSVYLFQNSEDLPYCYLLVSLSYFFRTEI